MRPSVKYPLLTLLWAAVAAYVVWATGATQANRTVRKVDELRIDIVDSTSQGHLVTSAEIRKWLAAERIELLGQTADSVDLTAVEQLIARNGFVEKVAAYVTRNGVLHIDIRQRKPLLRLLTDGENDYVTPTGFIFAAPRASSLYVPVVTGPYRPPFPVGHMGEIRRHTDNELQRIEQEIERLEEEKLPIHHAERADNRAYNDFRRRRVKVWWKYLETEAEYDARVGRLRAEKQQARRAYRYRVRQRRQQLDRIGTEQDRLRAQQKKLEKSYEDFVKLLTFVKLVEKDDFWSAEVVQIIARTAASGALEIELIPRSGRHIIRFGRLERMEEKLDKLLRFYRKGLSHIGWERCRVIDIRYTDQVVCR